MNTTDAEIAGKVKSVNVGDYNIEESRIVSLHLLRIRDASIHDDGVTFTPSDLLAFCRAVVERVDGEPIVMNTPRYSPAPRTFFTVEETREWILGELIYDGNGNEPEMFKEKNRHTRFLAGYLDDKEDGLAATTARHRKEQG